MWLLWCDAGMDKLETRVEWNEVKASLSRSWPGGHFPMLLLLDRAEHWTLRPWPRSNFEVLTFKKALPPSPPSTPNLNFHRLHPRQTHTDTSVFVSRFTLLKPPFTRPEALRDILLRPRYTRCPPRTSEPLWASLMTSCQRGWNVLTTSWCQTIRYKQGPLDPLPTPASSDRMHKKVQNSAPMKLTIASHKGGVFNKPWDKDIL